MESNSKLSAQNEKRRVIDRLLNLLPSFKAFEWINNISNIIFSFSFLLDEWWDLRRCIWRIKSSSFLLGTTQQRRHIWFTREFTTTLIIFSHIWTKKYFIFIRISIIFLLRSSIINSPVNNLVYLWIFIEFGFYIKSKFKGKIINFTFVS